MSGQVYFAHCFAANGSDMGAVKIGCSWHLPDRLDSVAMNQPYDCRLLASCDGAFFDETAAHVWLHEHRIAGEYFHTAPEVMAFVDHVKLHNAFPFRLGVTENNYINISMAHVRAFVALHGLKPADLARVTGAKPETYQTLIRSDRRPNRRLVAAAALAAVRKGITVSIDDFIDPAQPLSEAA